MSDQANFVGSVANLSVTVATVHERYDVRRVGDRYRSGLRPAELALVCRVLDHNSAEGTEAA